MKDASEFVGYAKTSGSGGTSEESEDTNSGG